MTEVTPAHRRRAARTRASGFLLPFLWIAALACTEGEPRPPHVILISIDTLNRDALSAFDPQAAALPALDALAAESVRFQNGLSTASWTLPAHASLLTGLYPDRHGATDVKVTMEESAATLAAELARRGYETAAFTGGGFVHEDYGMGRGFRVFESATKERRGPAETAGELLERVRAYLAGRSGADRPHFLFLHTYAVHNYYDVREEAVAKLGNQRFLTREQYIGCVLGRHPCTPGVWGQLEDLYRSELELMDASFGELVAELRAADLWDDAVVIFVSDHGEGFDHERGRLHHGGRLHEDQLRVPFMVRVPGVEPRDEGTAASLVDVMPTVLELVGLPVPEDLDGRSLVPLLEGAAGEGDGRLQVRPLYAMEHHFSWSDGRRSRAESVQSLPLSMAVVQGDGWFIRGSTAEELFDMRADPRQMQNGLEEGHEAEPFRALLEARMRPRTETGERGENAALTEDLKALGYGGDDS